MHGHTRAKYTLQSFRPVLFPGWGTFLSRRPASKPRADSNIALGLTRAGLMPTTNEISTRSQRARLLFMNSHVRLKLDTGNHPDSPITFPPIILSLHTFPTPFEGAFSVVGELHIQKKTMPLDAVNYWGCNKNSKKTTRNPF